MWVTVDPETSIPNPAMSGLTQALVNAVMELRTRFTVALHKAMAGVFVVGLEMFWGRAGCVCVCADCKQS